MTPEPARQHRGAHPGWRGALRDGLSLRALAGGLVLGVGLAAALTLATWSLLGAPPVAPRDVALVIPAGTAARVAAGEASGLPTELRLTEGDRLVISNGDAEAHVIGGWRVAPGATFTVIADAPASSLFACSIHPSGQLGFVVGARPSAALGVLLTLLVGVPVGLLLAAGWTAMRALEPPEPPEPPGRATG
jgi:hypothetical protein